MEKWSYLLDKSEKTPLYIQLYQQIKRSIYDQKLQKGDKLPSKRSLREWLQISQNTIESAYAQLIAEGYIESKPKSGFFVCFQAELGLPEKIAKKSANLTACKQVEKYEIDFDPNRIDSENFPIHIWKKCAAYRQTDFLNMGEKQGDFYLREQISDYLSSARGVDCEPKQIIIGAGVESCMQQLILLFQKINPHFTYAMESYGYATVEKLLNLYDKQAVKIPINNVKENKENNQIDFEFLTKNKINIAYLTPNHLYPFGQSLTIGERQKLLEWANETSDRFIIEDDYDSEFRHRGKPIPALQSLDQNDKVIYLGSFSKLLMPSLRITFLVLPKALLSLYQQHCYFFNSPVSRLEQQRLANFIQQGEFTKHINRMRKIYRRKMELVLSLLNKQKIKIRTYGEHLGFYLLLELIEEKRHLKELTELAKKAKIKIYPMPIENRKLFILGFGHLSEEQIKNGIDQLLVAWA